jgi:eukaryotic-like serine/threonine-protein kinase
MTKTIGQYEIGELLGEGGLGQVHAAFDTVLQREVAVKSLRPELLNDSNFVERFRIEATNLARLNHPNITTIYSLIPDGKNLYMVMERVRGHTLDDILQKRNAPIEVRESLAIIAQAADGLAYAHSMGVIHRDIKPANLMIAENGVLKIMDFGIARVRGSQRLTRTGSIVGTLAYMAPEQLRGEEGDEASDLYSLGIVLYEMLSGNPPFSATSEYDLMQAQINQRPERLIPRVPGLSPGIETALLRALSKKPAQRFPSTRAFSDALGASALRMDAPKILHNDTRLLETPVPLASATPQRRSGLARVAAALPFWTNLSPELRAATVGGAGALVIALAFATFMFWPSSAPAPLRAPAPQAAPATSAKPMAAVPAPTPPAQSVTPVILPDASTKHGAATPQNSGTEVKPMSSPPASLADLIPAADRGDPTAQNALGVKYVAGEDGLPRDDVKAVEWYRKAALQNYAKAETNLGDMYLEGRGGLDKNPLEALSWYLKAAQQGWPDAQYRLGYLYEVGLGTAKDPQRAVSLYRSAAESGYPDAQNLLGYFYATGSYGIQQDDKEAVGWYRKAAEQGFAKAQKNLADMFFFGRGVDARDYEQAMMWYQKAADQKFGEAQFRLGYMYEKGFGTEASVSKAITLYKAAVTNGSVEAQRALDRLNAEPSNH